MEPSAGGCNTAIAAALSHDRPEPFLTTRPNLTHSYEPRGEHSALRKANYPRIRITIAVPLLIGAWRRKLVRRLVESSTRKNVSLPWRADVEGRFNRDRDP